MRGTLTTAAAFAGPKTQTPGRRKPPIIIKASGEAIMNVHAVMKRVLIVDDEAIVLTVLRDFFASFRHGYAYEITTTESASEAFQIGFSLLPRLRETRCDRASARDDGWRSHCKRGRGTGRGGSWLCVQAQGLTLPLRALSRLRLVAFLRGSRPT